MKLLLGCVLSKLFLNGSIKQNSFNFQNKDFSFYLFIYWRDIFVLTL